MQILCSGCASCIKYKSGEVLSFARRFVLIGIKVSIREALLRENFSHNFSSTQRHTTVRLYIANICTDLHASLHQNSEHFNDATNKWVRSDTHHCLLVLSWIIPNHATLVGLFSLTLHGQQCHFDDGNDLNIGKPYDAVVQSFVLSFHE
jgi:hypothetical protein